MKTEKPIRKFPATEKERNSSAKKNRETKKKFLTVDEEKGIKPDAA